MQRQLTRLLAGLTLVAGLGILGPARPVRLAAVGDVLLTGPATYDFNALAAGDGGSNAAIYEVIGNLTLQTGTVIECNDPASPPNDPACDIKITVTGNLLMAVGSAINADNTHAGGKAGDITITVGGSTGGTMTMCGQTGAQTGCTAPPPNTPGAFISARNLGGTNAGDVGGDISITVGSAATVLGAFYMEGGSTTYGEETGARIDATAIVHSGDITITPGGSYFAEPGSVVESGGYAIGQAPMSNQQGGKIYIVSGCQLTTEGRITSKGRDPGADLIHLEGCEVGVRGLVESTGKGHTVGDIPAEPPHNSCDGNNDGLTGEVIHTDKPLNATGCIEVWGKVITIDSLSHVDPQNLGSPLRAGELNADIGDGGPEGTSWIDVFGFAQLTVTDGTGNDRLSDNLGHVYFSTYAVHANAIDGSDVTPGVVTAKVQSGPLTASGKAFEASSTMTPVTGHDDGNVNHQFIGNGSTGGTIDLEASGTVDLDKSFINAAGDFAGGFPCPPSGVSGACGDGGHIIVKAWGIGSDISWLTFDGDVQPNTTGGTTVGGDITLGACDSIDTTGTDFHGETPVTSTGGVNCDATKPSIPAYAGRFPGYTYNVFNSSAWTLCGASTISGIKFNDLNANGVQDQGEPTLSGWTIHLFNASFHQTQVTGAGGAYTFSGIAPGTYTVCEAAQPTPATTAPWQQTYPTSGANCLTTSDPPQDNPNPGMWGYAVNLTTGECCSGQTITGKDFGNVHLATKSGVKWLDDDGDHTRDLPTDVGLNGWVIHLFGTAVNGASVHLSTTTSTISSVAGAYTFTVLPGTYTVCEVQQTDYTQTFPATAVDCAAGGVPTPGPYGYSIVLHGGDAETGNDFGNDYTPVLPPNFECPEDPNRAALITRSVNKSIAELSGGGVAGSPKNYWTIQAAYNAALASSQSEVIGLFANTSENLVLGGTKSLTITQCTVARVTAANATLPVWNITSTGKLTIVGPDSVGGSIGWQVGGNGGHTLKSIRANGASVDGVLITSSNNSVSWNDVSGNGNGTANAAGIRAQGGTNILKGGTVASNKGDGVQLIGNSNELSGSTIQSNTGNGVFVSGSSNTVKSNSRINLNTKNGIQITGSTNTASSNASESGKGNTLNGILVSGGTGNQLTDNKMASNGQAGFNLAAGTGTKVKSNANTNNTGNEFTIGTGNTDQGSNKKNGTGFTFTTTGGNFN